MEHHNAHRCGDIMFCEDCQQWWEADKPEPPQCHHVLFSPVSMVKITIQALIIAFTLFGLAAAVTYFSF